jgi:predicted dithiol-disulfide oxidoreductase (DUF899 family)
MCPACITTAALIVAGATSTGGLTKENKMDRSKVVSQAEWLAARKQHLKKEKEFTRLRDELSAERRALPWVKVDKNYVFEGPNGRRTLADLFEGKRQLLVYHFMFDPEWGEGCRSCSFAADHFAGVFVHLAAYDTSFAVISRAPFAKIERFKKRKRWDFPWLSSFGTDFNYDFQVTLDENHTEYNYTPVSARPAHMQGKGEWPGISVFMCDGKRLFHTYSTYARGIDPFLNTYNFLDLTPLGRQEEAHAPVGARYNNRSQDRNT